MVLQEILNYEVIDKIKVSDSNDKTEYLNVVKQEELQLGVLKFKNIPAVVADINSIPIFRCMHIDGFIGSNLLRNSVIQIDKLNDKVIITDDINNLKVNQNNASKLSLKKRQSAPNTWVKYQNNTQELLLIDTGFTGFYCLKEDNFNALNQRKELEVIAQSEGLGSVGLYGLGETYKQVLFNMPKIEINNFTMLNYISSTSNDNQSKIGARLLDYGVMTLDYKKKKFYFNAYDGDKINVNNIQHNVEFTYKGKQIVVANIWDESLKDKIKLGDELIKTDHLPIDVCSLANQVKKESFLAKIRTQNGEVLDLKIEPIQKPSKN